MSHARSRETLLASEAEAGESRGEWEWIVEIIVVDGGIEGDYWSCSCMKGILGCRVSQLQGRVWHPGTW